MQWALRIPSPSKAFEVAGNRWLDDGMPIDLYTGTSQLDVRPEDGLLTFKEAWTGK